MRVFGGGRVRLDFVAARKLHDFVAMGGEVGGAVVFGRRAMIVQVQRRSGAVPPVAEAGGGRRRKA